MSFLLKRSSLVVTGYAPSDGSLLILPGSLADYASAVLGTMPDGFGDGEFALEIWIKATTGITVASTASVKFERWSSDNAAIYSAADWWYLGNFLLDGHNNGTNSSGTFSLQLAASGRVQWLFGDGAAADARVGDLHGLRGTSNLLDGAWHQIVTVRRWSGGSDSTLELWIDGVLEDTETSTARTNMATTYWDGGFPGFPVGQRNWMFGVEKQSSLGSIEWEHFMGKLDRIRFYNRAPTTGELESGSITSGLVGFYDFEEGSGTSAADTEGGAAISLNDADQYQWITDDGA